MVQPDFGEAPLAAHRGPGFQLPGDVIAMLAFHFTSAVDGIVRELSRFPRLQPGESAALSTGARVPRRPPELAQRPRARPRLGGLAFLRGGSVRHTGWDEPEAPVGHAIEIRTGPVRASRKATASPSGGLAWVR
jgi:hypothetical protein